MGTITALPPGMAVGFKFHPTDEELIRAYLEPKLLGKSSEVDRLIVEVDFCKFELLELPCSYSKSKIESNDRIWLFFCRGDYNYPSSERSKRTTRRGFWKIIGNERVIKDQETKACIGKKRTFLFHMGSTGQRTNWVMQEYYIESDKSLSNQRPYVLCHLKRKANMASEPSNNIVSEVENPATHAANPWAHGAEEAYRELRSQPLYGQQRHIH